MKTIALLLPLCLTACALLQPKPSAGEHYFNTEVKPVLQQHCLRCHNGTMPTPALDLSNRAKAFAPRPSARPFILPGNPDGSLLIQAVQRGGTHRKAMPQTDLSLTDDQIGMLREWIEDGVPWPTGPSGELRHQPSGEHP